MKPRPPPPRRLRAEPSAEEARPTSTRPWRCPRCALYDAWLILYPDGELELAHEGCLYQTVNRTQEAA